MIEDKSKASVLFVCMGNICRSPTAQGVAEAQLKQLNLADRISVDSAGTHDYHVGARPDSRAVSAAAARGIDLSGQRARQVGGADFFRFDYVLAMDRNNLAELRLRKPPDSRAWLGQLGQLSGASGPASAIDVPDPYYGEAEGFEQVLDLLEEAIAELWPGVVSRHTVSQ